MKIHLTKPAVNDLVQIDKYINLDNPSAGANIVLRILDAIEYLSIHPTMGRSGRVPKTRELIIGGTPFIVVYQIRRQLISVTRILHAARKWI